MQPKSLPLPDQALAALLKKIPPYIRRTFLSAVVLGIVTHLYMLTNKLPNHDDISCLLGVSYGTQSGRWLLPAVLQWDGSYSMPWLIGVLSILCLAVTACFAVSLLRIRSRPGCIVAAALLVSFPSVAATFSYMFTADAYFLGTMLAAFGAYTAVRHRKWGIPLGIVAIVLSMGIYQSYFPVAAVLMVGALIFEALDGQNPFRQLLLQGIRLAAILLGSMAVYMVVVRITTREVGLVDYMGISSMGQLSLSQLPALIFKSYREYWVLFAQNGYGFHMAFVKPLTLLAGLGTVILLVVILQQRKLGWLRAAFVVVLVILYPLAGNLTHIMTNGMQVHSLMIYGMVCRLVAPVALAEYAAGTLDALPAGKRTVCTVISWFLLLSMGLTAYSYVVLDNQAYLKLQVTYEQGTAYSNRLLGAIEGCDGYEPGLPVVLVGSGAYTGDLYPTPGLNQVHLTGIMDLAGLRTSYTYAHFLRYYLGYTGAIYLQGSEEADTMAETEKVQAMPVYPASGSVQRIGDTIVVKLGEPAQSPS